MGLRGAPAMLEVAFGCGGSHLTGRHILSLEEFQNTRLHFVLNEIPRRANLYLYLWKLPKKRLRSVLNEIPGRANIFVLREIPEKTVAFCT